MVITGISLQKQKKLLSQRHHYRSSCQEYPWEATLHNKRNGYFNCPPPSGCSKHQTTYPGGLYAPITLKPNILLMKKIEGLKPNYQQSQSHTCQRRSYLKQFKTSFQLCVKTLEKTTLTESG